MDNEHRRTSKGIALACNNHPKGIKMLLTHSQTENEMLTKQYGMCVSGTKDGKRSERNARETHLGFDGLPCPVVLFQHIHDLLSPENGRESFVFPIEAQSNEPVPFLFAFM